MKKKIKPTEKGYIRYHVNGRLRMEHCVVWEKYFGEIPEGMQIHHIDGDKTNNDISNLQLVTALEHKRIHEGCKKVMGIWYKPCKCCGQYKPIDKENWYITKKGWIANGVCRICSIKKSLETRKAMIARGWKRKDYGKIKRENAKAESLRNLRNTARQTSLFD